ncbi:hypothetical protein BDU57DRAFT_232374 [Ampelomyces quisqualis]|uniref:Uncharacterized protein n=1 Tax=Ampelomyces quisqualis TaxID=50730 RepID=A0A6A5QLG0_AMPQU|nr:hypothetical protein BDU57DRAFT_232374 [Ampelomyces quisqualis]
MWDIAIKSGLGVRPRPWVPVDARTTPEQLLSMTQPSPLPDQYDDDDKPLATFTATENASLAALLEPVHDQLLQLRKTTPEGYPDYERGVRNSHILGHDYGKALCERIAGIGEHIKRYLAGIPESSRGRMELNLCHYIASEYWPLPGKWGTHLTIMAMYTNTLAGQIPPQLYASAEAGWQEWTREREDRRRAGLGVWSFEDELVRFRTKQAWDKQAVFSGSSDTDRDDNLLQNNQEDAQVALLLAKQEREEQEAQDRELAARIQAEHEALLYRLMPRKPRQTEPSTKARATMSLKT